MAITRADWKQYSHPKQEFCASIFTCYRFEGGVLCVDEQKRLQLVRAQLEKQSRGDEQIIVRPDVRRYIIVDGLKKDGVTLKGIDELAGIKVLCLKQRSLDPGHEEFEKRTLLGGLSSETSTVPNHYERNVRSKMCNGADQIATTFTSGAIFREFYRIDELTVDDLTVFSYCSIHPDELAFLLEDKVFCEAIRLEATRLVRETRLKLSVTVLEKEILNHILCCSSQVGLQTSLANLSAPSVHTHVVLYTGKFFNNISKFGSGTTSYTPEFVYRADCGFLSDYVSQGPLIYASLPEYSDLLRVLLFFRRFANIPVSDTEDGHPLLDSSAVLEMLKKISTKQIDNIKKGVLPLPPASMGSTWDPRRTFSDTLTIVRRTYCINLYNIAEMVNVPRREAPGFFGLNSSADVDSLNQAIQGLWDSQTPALEQAIERFLDEQKKRIAAQQTAGAATPPINLEARVQPSGIHLGSKVFALQEGPGELSIFAHSSRQAKWQQELVSTYETELMQSYGADVLVLA